MPSKRHSTPFTTLVFHPRNKLMIIIATALGTLTLPAFAAPASAQEDTITVVGGSNNAQQESAWGPVGTIVAKRSATGTKTDTSLVKTPQSVSVVTREQMDTL